MKILTGTKIDVQTYYQSTISRFMPDIIEISAPLKKIGIPYFAYIEFDLLNNQAMGFTNQDAAARYFFSHQGIKIEPIPTAVKNKNFFYFNSEMIAISKKTENYYAGAMQSSGILDTCVHVVIENNISKFYTFGLTNLCKPNLELLDAFTLYFNDKANHLIKKSDHWTFGQKIFLRKSPDLNIYQSNDHDNKKVHEFLNDINYQHYRLHKLALKYSLSKREVECIDLVLQNKISKEIAYILGLSVRTIEAYLENIKRKTHCRSKTELISKLINV
jgi:DNA-binding CsgD family transcriptional regulator